MATFPEAPLRSRTVGFPESGSGLGFPTRACPPAVRFKRCLASAPVRRWSAFVLVLTLGGDFLPAQSPGVLQLSETAKCPGLLCPARVLPPPAWRRAPHGRALPLRRSSYEPMRRTRLLSPPLVSLSAIASDRESSQVVDSPCWGLVLPDVISAGLSLVAWIPAAAAPPVHMPVNFPEDIGHPRVGTGWLCQRDPLSDFRAGIDFAAVTISCVQAPRVLATQVAPTLLAQRQPVAFTSVRCTSRYLPVLRICLPFESGN
jgi:hypothetical protein